MTKNALFVFKGDPMCFIHVLLNALDMHAKGAEVKIVMEGEATRLIPELAKEAHPLHQLWQKAVAAELVEGVCKACSQKMGTADAAQQAGFTLLDDMTGHPGMARFQQSGYQVITF
jgi:hypothetical protein